MSYNNYITNIIKLNKANKFNPPTLTENENILQNRIYELELIILSLNDTIKELKSISANQVWYFPIALTSSESRVLDVLLKFEIARKSQIYDLLYPLDKEIEPKIVDVFICKLRNKFNKMESGKNIIETKWGEGYFIMPENKKYLIKKYRSSSNGLE